MKKILLVVFIFIFNCSLLLAQSDYNNQSNLTLNLKCYLEGFWNGTTHVQDSINIYLQQPASPFNRIDSAGAFLSSSGVTNATFTNAPAGNYYIAVKHLNHLETWSSSALAFSNNSPVNYDFTTDSSKALGNNMKKVGTKWVLYGGDANGDGSIDANDLVNLIPMPLHYDRRWDFNGDGFVDVMDVAIFSSNYGLTKVR